VILLSPGPRSRILANRLCHRLLSAGTELCIVSPAFGNHQSPLIPAAGFRFVIGTFKHSEERSMRRLFATMFSAAFCLTLVTAPASAEQSCCAPTPKRCTTVCLPPVVCRRPPANCIRAPIVKPRCAKRIRVCCPQPVKRCLIPTLTWCKPKATCCAPQPVSCVARPSCSAPHAPVESDATPADTAPAPPAE